jgi:hypothetical protein
MQELRTTDKREDDCERLHIDEYSLKEVRLPAQFGRRKKAIEIVIRGRNLRAMAQPLVAFVGKEPVQYTRIAPDERSVQGLLLNEPERGARVSVFLGDLDAAQHAAPFNPAMVTRIE